MGSQQVLSETSKEVVSNENEVPIAKAVNTVFLNPIKEQNIIPPKHEFKYTISLQNLKDTFKYFAIDNQYLNKDLFNDAIQSLFRFQIPAMHYTYLSEKIYDLLDDSGDGKIQEDEFIQGFKNVLTDKEFRLRCKNVLFYYSINDGYDE